ncbi:hypothetical protein HHL19_21845 [Streptomyces sp. R302]|uniref:hypothetical protein n=1 Tax=unclassified Streptomyces TaxID=2593676 RepID=UPI00145D5AF3|nr:MULTISPECIES: hypothetical protein [unclassified Streptomyces]NML51618.1 hypothetical protein [Streptomyces sp. R301]NML81238.1 hypothetical protein [Streptomyces sp. R302]
MPFNYVTVTASSELFAPATRAFGDILVLGKGAVGRGATTARSFTYPGKAVEAYPKGATTLAAKADKAATTVTAAASFPVGTRVRIGEGEEAEYLTIKSVAEVEGGGGGEGPGEVSSFTWTLEAALAADHPSGDPLVWEKPNDVAAAIATAFRQTPPPTRVWGIEVDPADPDWDTAFTEAEDLPVQILVLANTPLNGNPATDHPVELLAKHVVDVSNTGGDGKERIGVAALDPGEAQSAQVKRNAGAIKTDRMVLVAHKESQDDVAAAVAGVIAGHEPHISLLLKPINMGMSGLFTATEIETYYTNSINWVTSPVMLPGHGLYLGEGLTASPAGNKAYVDIVRTLDDISFRIKAALIEAIGDIRIDRPGLRTVVTLVQSVLSPLVTRDVIEEYVIHIPLLVLLEREPATLAPDEVKQIGNGRSTRSVDMEVSVVYAGVIHQIAVKLALKG